MHIHTSVSPAIRVDINKIYFNIIESFFFFWTMQRKKKRETIHRNSVSEMRLDVSNGFRQNTS